MLDYYPKTVEVHRYFLGFIFINLSYGLGRPALLKQLSKSTGLHTFQDYALTINLLECLGFMFGVIWGIASILTF